MNLTKCLLRFFKHYATPGSEPDVKGALGKLNVNISCLPLLKSFLAVLLLLFTGKLTAQDAAEPPSFRGQVDFKIGYFGNLRSNQGLSLGTEYVWLEKVKVRDGRKGQKTIRRQLLLNGSLGYSTNFATQTQNGVFAYSGLTLRRVNTKGGELFVELNPLGLYRSVLPDTYEVVDEDVSSVSFPGRSYYAPSVAMGIGGSWKGVKRSGWYLNLQYTLLTNYNSGILPIFSLNFGYKFSFNK